MATRHAVVIGTVLGIVLAGGALGGCERKAAPGAGGAPGDAPGGAPAGDVAAPPTAAERAERIRASVTLWPKVEGRWTRGDTDSRYVAHFEAGELRYLEEDMSMGDYGTRRNRYYYEGGALFYYAGEKSSDVPGSTGPGGLPSVVPVVAEFRGPEVVRAVGREHFGEKVLDPAIVEGIRRHAAVLAGAAQDEWSAQQR